MRGTRTDDASVANDAGFGLIEIVISMFLLGILTIAFLPLLIQSTRLSSTNATIARATQLVSEAMAEARATGPNCSTLPASGTETNVHGTDYTLQRARATCPADAASYPTTVLFSVEVREDASSLAKASTLILVTAP